MGAMTRLIPLAAVLALASCGSSDNPKPAAVNQRDAALNYARCMRAHGIDMADPKTTGNGMMLFNGPGPGSKQPSPKTQRTAQAACQHFVDAVKPPKLSDADRKRMRDAALANARCMREHGIDFP